MKRAREEEEDAKKREEDEDEDDEEEEDEEASESISLAPDEDETSQAAKRPRLQAAATKPKANALQRLEELQGSGDRPKFAKNLVSNMFRLSRIARQATRLSLGQEAAPEGHEDSIEFSKDVHEPILQFFTEHLELMLEGAKDIQMLRDRQRLSAEDLRATIDRDPRFLPFRVDELLATSGATAPALTTILNTLSVGKGAGRKSRILYEYMLEEPPDDDE